MIKNLSIIILLSFVGSACSNDDIAGEINGDDITNLEFDAYLKFKRIKVRDDEHRKELIQQYLEREALARAVADQELLDEQVIKAELNDFKQQMYISRYFETYLKQAVTEQAVKNYYVSHAKDYEHKQVHVAHILVRTNRNMTETEKDARKTTIHEAYSKLKAGKAFDKIADAYSEDKISAKKGGDLGWLKQGAINKSFTEKAFALKKGEISEPFETPFGFHVVKLIEEAKTVKKPFEAVKGDIRYKLRQQAKNAEIEKLKATIEIKVNG